MNARKVGEEKIALRVFMVGSYKTVSITPTLTCEEVEQVLKKKLAGSASEVDLKGFQLFQSIDQKETVVAQGDVVWNLYQGSPGSAFIFKAPNSDFIPPRDTLPPQRPKRRNRVHSKKSEKRNLLDDVNLFRVRGVKTNQQERTVWVRFKDKQPQQFTLSTNTQLELCVEQCCDAFDIEDPAQYLFQEKTQNLYCLTMSDVFSLPPDQPITLVQKPDSDVKKCIEMIAQSASGPSIRDNLKVLKAMAKDEAWKLIIPLFLHHKGLPFALSIIDHAESHPTDTLLLTLSLLGSCMDAYRLPTDDSLPYTMVPALQVQPSTIRRLTKLAVGTSDQGSFSVRISSTEFLLNLLDYEPSFYSPVDTELREMAKNKPPDRLPRPSNQRANGGSSGGSMPHMLGLLSMSFLETASSDVIVAVSVLNLISLVVSRAPFAMEKGKPGESKEEKLQFLFDDVRFVDQIHRLAVTPGREEVEKALVLLQRQIVEASFWEKDEVFQRDNAEHEANLKMLWTTAYPDVALNDRVSKLWKRMGFQSDDPTRDFRAMGLLGLKHLNYMASHQNRPFRSMCDEMHSRTERFYPIATAGMLMSQMLVTHLTEMTEGHGKVLPCLFDGGEAICQLYCTLMKALFRLFDERNADYMDFNLIRGELKELFEQSLEDCTTVRQLGQHILASEGSGEEDKKVTIRTTAVFQWGLGPYSSPTIEHLGSLMSKPVVSIAASSHVVVVTETEGVWGWGACSCGQLGFETTEKKFSSPVYLDSFSSKQVVKVFANDGRTAGTTTTGELWMCGEQIPAREGEPPQSTTLRRVTLGGSGGSEVMGVTKVAFGQAHGAILVRSERSGKVYTWGHNSFFQLGHSEKDQVVLWPGCVSGLSNMNVVNVSAGRHFCVAYGSDRSVVAWGHNLFKSTGGAMIPILGTHEKDKEFIERPKVVRGFKPFTVLNDVVCGNTHIVALTKKGQVLTWGEGKGGKLGHGSEESYSKPKEVNIEPCAAVSAGYNYTLAIGKSGKLYSWGEGGRGALGHGDLNGASSPKEVLVSGKSVKCEKMCASTCGLTVSVMMYFLPSVSASVFGVPLARLMTQHQKQHGPLSLPRTTGSSGVPYVVRTLCEHIENEGGGVAGLFPDEEKYRAMKGDTPLRLLRHCFESTQDVDMGGVHPQTSVALLIHWVEELPSPIIAPNVYNELVRVGGLTDPARRCAEFGEIVYHLMNSHASGVFRYLIALFGRLVVSERFLVGVPDLEFTLSVVCGLKAKRVGLGREGQGGGQGGGGEGKKRMMFESLLKDVGIVQFPFYVTLLGVFCREFWCTLEGGALRELWCAFVVLGMPQRLQSQLLWRLRDYRLVLDSSSSLGEKKSFLKSSSLGCSLMSSVDISSPPFSPPPPSLSPPSLPPSSSPSLSPSSPSPSASACPSPSASPSACPSAFLSQSLSSPLSKSTIATSRSTPNCTSLSRRPPPPSRPPPSPAMIISEKAAVIEKEISDFLESERDPVEEWVTSVGLHRKLVILRIEEMAHTTPDAPKASLDDFYEVVSEVVSFLRERATSHPRLEAYNSVRSSLNSSLESLQQHAPYFSLHPPPPSHHPPLPLLTSTLGESVGGDLGGGGGGAGGEGEGEGEGKGESGEDGTEWGWSNLQATHLVSKELYQSTCALSALEDGVEREMKQFFDMYFVLKKRWDEMREKQTQIHQQLHNLTSKLLPFFEKAQQVLKASLEQEKENREEKKDISSLLLDSIEGFVSHLQDILSQADRRADVSIEERQKLVQSALDMQEYIDRTCQSEAFASIRQSPQWASSSKALDAFLVSYLSSNLSPKTDGFVIAPSSRGNSSRSSRSATVIASSRVSPFRVPPRVSGGSGGSGVSGESGSGDECGYGRQLSFVEFEGKEDVSGAGSGSLYDEYGRKRRM